MPRGVWVSNLFPHRFPDLEELVSLYLLGALYDQYMLCRFPVGILIQLSKFLHDYSPFYSLLLNLGDVTCESYWDDLT